ncbi:MAG TPA: DUF5916 domain-containing protein [Pyrinomonadaceae bacterium]
MKKVLMNRVLIKKGPANGALMNSALLGWVVLIALLITVPGGACVRAQSAPAEGSVAAKKALVLPPEKARPVRLTRFEQPPLIDGRLDDEAWRRAAAFKDFYQLQPGDNTPASKPTEVLIGYDAKTLYVAFHAFDEPGKVRATVAKRDAVETDDNVSIFLDTFNDQRKAYAFYFNPLGVQSDAILTESAGLDFSVDIVMESKGAITEDGYTVEVAIPFKSLRYEAGKDKLWGLHLRRVIKRFNNELDSWMPLSRDRSGVLNQAGQLTGLEGISTEHTLELIPSATLSETGKRVPTLSPAELVADPARTDPGRFVNPALDFDPGLTAKFGITPTVTLDLALNPDFAQVEADQLVVTANQRFPIFFEEKRPFFLEGIDIFRTPVNVVNTRAIVDPDVAVKLTGKRGRNTFGLLLASDNAPGNFSEEERSDPERLARIARFLDKNAYIAVLRLKRDVGRESSVGFVGTSYNFIEKHNQLGGFDGRFRLDPKTVFTFQALGTTSRRFFFEPETGRNIYRTGNAFRYYWDYDRRGRNLSVSLYGTGQTRDYRADVGFTRRTNINNENIFIGYNSTPRPRARLISWSIQNFNPINFDWQGRMLGWAEDFNVGFGFRRQASLNVAYVGEYERIFEGEFGARRSAPPLGCVSKERLSANAALRCGFAGDDAERSTRKQSLIVYGRPPASKLFSGFFEFDYTHGEFDFDFGAGPRFPRVSPGALADPDALQDPGPGNYLRFVVRLNFQPTDLLRISLDYEKSRLVRHDTGLLAFDENLSSLRATYQFTRFTFARARVDYTTLSARVRGQFLLGWTPNPGTSFYVGYNDDLNRHGSNPFTGQLEPGFRRNGRTFFVKLSYLFRRSF